MLTDGIARVVERTIVRVTSDRTAAKVTAFVPPAPYPADLEHVETLRDGAVVRVRPIRSDDEPRLQALFERLSPQTVYQRFFASHRRLPAAWYREFANVDYRRRLALVAEDAGPDGIRLRGVARWEPAEEGDGLEVALVIEDAWQGRGLGGRLFRRLLEAAAARGIDRFCADVLAENERMLHLLRTATVIRESSLAHGVVHVRFGRRHPVALAEQVA